MNYLKITKYLYLIIGFVMLYAAAMKWNDLEKPWLEIILSGTAFFTYFFRNQFDKKFAERKNQNSQTKPNNP